MIEMTNKKGKKIQIEIRYFIGKKFCYTKEEFSNMWDAVIDYIVDTAVNDMMVVLIDEETLLAGEIINGKAPEVPDTYKIIRDNQTKEGKIFLLRKKPC